MLDDAAVLVAGVAPAHLFEDQVVGRLERQVQVLADPGQVADGGEQVVVYVPRMRGQEPHPPDTGDPLDSGQQSGQARTVRGITVGVDGLAQERNFAHSLRREPSHVLEHVFHRPASFRAADEGDDAKAADLVAAEDHRDVGGQAMLQDGTPGLGRIRLVLTRQVAYEGFVLAHVEPVVEVGQALVETVLFLVRHAAGDGDGAARPLSLPAAQLAEPSVRLLLGVLPYRAGDQDRQVSTVEIRDLSETCRGHPLGQVVGVRLVHLAAAHPQVEPLPRRSPLTAVGPGP